MEQFLKDCYKANENWRQVAYHELVTSRGISVGTCIQVSYETGTWNNKQTVYATGVITKINWDTINVFTGMSKHSQDSHSPLQITVFVDGENKVLLELDKKFNCIGENGINHGYYHREKGCKLLSVITNSPTPLPPEWVTSYKESFETLVKKRNIEQLKNGMKSEWKAPNLVAHIDAWK
tara:strand:- start:35 stop:571 length:537 start_codon:yes stop_codon:yes gene_type:complete